MKYILSFIITLLTITATETDTGSNWAVLIAGSNGYYNYRHQSDIAHSYQILTTMGGFPPDKVIVMMYNDVVNDPSNPFPGQLFNEPGGKDVYGDIKVSYSGDKVTAKNFLNVIQGIKEGDTKDGPVLESGAEDHVFIYYSDHGATALVAMPAGDTLSCFVINPKLSEMIQTVKKIGTRGKGILAAGESPGTIGKRLTNINISNTEQNRSRYRELFVTSDGIEQYISGIILHDETKRKKTCDNVLFVDVLKKSGVIIGIKVDKRTRTLPYHPSETYTQGLTNLYDRY